MLFHMRASWWTWACNKPSSTKKILPPKVSQWVITKWHCWANNADSNFCFFFPLNLPQALHFRTTFATSKGKSTSYNHRPQQVATFPNSHRLFPPSGLRVVSGAYWQWPCNCKAKMPCHDRAFQEKATWDHFNKWNFGSLSPDAMFLLRLSLRVASCTLATPCTVWSINDARFLANGLWNPSLHVRHPSSNQLHRPCRGAGTGLVFHGFISRPPFSYLFEIRIPTLILTHITHTYTKMCVHK